MPAAAPGSARSRAAGGCVPACPALWRAARRPRLANAVPRARDARVRARRSPTSRSRCKGWGARRSRCSVMRISRAATCPGRERRSRSGVRALRARGGLGRRGDRNPRSARRRRVRARRREDVDIERGTSRISTSCSRDRRRRGERPDGVRRGAATPGCSSANGSRRCRRIRSVRCGSIEGALSVSRRIGEEGEGFKIAMATLDVFRSTVGAAAVGFGRRALDESLAHARSRAALRRAARGVAVDAGGDRGDGDRRRCEHAARASRRLDEGLRPRTR